MKKILGLTIAAVMVMAVAGVGTWAYFSDTETSTGNILTAGTLDLNVDGGDTPVITLSVPTTFPGDSGSGSTTLLNDGSIAGELDISSGSVTNTGAVGGTSEYADDYGHLGDVATIAIYIDVNQTSDYVADTDIGLKSDGTIYTTGVLQYDTINNYASESWGGSNGVESLGVGISEDFTIIYLVPTTTGPVTGTADSGSTITLVHAALTQADDFFNGMTLSITAGEASGESSVITDFVSATGTITVSPAFTTAIDSTSVYSISTANSFQGDSVSIDFTFTLEQTDAD